MADARELVKTALIERLVRLGATDIPGTPRLLMRKRSPAELGALQQAVEQGYDKRVTDPLMGVIQKATLRLPEGKPKTILQKGARLVAEDPLGTLAANLVPLPGAHPAYVTGKKLLEKGIDRFAPVPMPKLAEDEGHILHTPQEAKKVLQPGDILVTTQVNTPTWHAPLARISKIVQGTEYDHSAIYMGKGRVGNMGLKFKDMSLPEFQAEYNYKAYRVKAPKKERNEAADWVRGQVGKKSFGPLGILTQFIPSLSRMDPEEARKKPSMICSAIVAAAFPKHEFGGRPILAARPVDFANPENTKYVAKTAELAEDGEHKLQGHIDFQGLNIAVENRKGSVRSGTKPDGSKWRTEMKAPYGYIEAPAKGKDGDSIDAYVGPKKDATHAFVVHQHKPDGTGHDEDKLMLAYPNMEAARKAYLAHYDSPKFLGPMEAIPMRSLKAFVGVGGYRKLTAKNARLLEGLPDGGVAHTKVSSYLGNRFSFGKSGEGHLSIELERSGGVGGVPPFRQPFVDSRFAYAKVASDCSNSGPLGPQQQGLVNTPQSWAAMNPSVDSLGDQLKVANAIVKSVPIPVVDDFVGEQGPAEKVGHDNSVLEFLSLTNVNESVLGSAPQGSNMSVGFAHNTEYNSSSFTKQATGRGDVHYDSPKFLGPISRIPMERLKEIVEKNKKIDKLAAVYMTRYLGTKVNVPTDMLTKVDPEAAKFREEHWGKKHHVTLLTSDEIARLKKKGHEPAYIKQVFDSVPTKTMVIERKPVVFDTPRRLYDVLPVQWPQAQAARAQFGLRPSNLHVTIGATEKAAAYEPPYTSAQIKEHYPDKAAWLLKDPVHAWRAKTGIELVHKEPSKGEQQRIWSNWQQMPPELQRKSDTKSVDVYGMTNAEHNTKLEKAAVFVHSASLKQTGI